MSAIDDSSSTATIYPFVNGPLDGEYHPVRADLPMIMLPVSAAADGLRQAAYRRITVRHPVGPDSTVYGYETSKWPAEKTNGSQRA